MKKILVVLVILSAFLMTSCDSNKNINDTKEKEIAVSQDKTEEISEEVEEKALTNEEKAINLVNSYVNAAKNLDFETMGKYITDSGTHPVLESYRQAYSKYSIADEKIKELCKARLGTYKITPISAVKNGSDIIVNVSILMVNMESLQNKWMETLCNKYPEYTTLSDEEMTPEVVEVLIETMIEVLNKAEASEEIKKDFTVNTNSEPWVINANNGDFFPSK